VATVGNKRQCSSLTSDTSQDSSNTLRRSVRSTKVTSYADAQQGVDKSITQRRNAVKVVDLILDLAKEDSTECSNLLNRVVNHTRMKDAKEEARLFSWEEVLVNTEIVTQVKDALGKLISKKGGNVNKLRQTVCNGVLEAVVSPTMESSVAQVSQALGVGRKHIEAATKRRGDKDKDAMWLVSLCDRTVGGGRNVDPEAVKAAVD